MRGRLTVPALVACLFGCTSEEVQVGIELEPSWTHDDQVRKYGVEDTFLLRGRAEGKTELSPGASLYARVRWQPPLSEYSLGYTILKEPSLAVQGAYVELRPQAGTLRLGVVEYPVGTDDELFLDKNNFAPLLRTRFPRFDVGALYSARGKRWKAELAVVNGEGGVYADANSDKTVAGRISAFIGPLEIGVTGAAGSRRSTPVKEEDDCYGVFACLGKGRMTVRAEVVWAKWDFRADYTDAETLEELQDRWNFGPAAYARLEEYIDAQYYAWGAKHSLGWYVRLDWEASEKLLLFLHGGQWEPDMDIDWSEYAQMKTRIAAGGKYALRSEEDSAWWVETFLSWTDDPCVSRRHVKVPVSVFTALRVEKRF